MKLREIAEKIDKSINNEQWVSIQEIAYREFDLNIPHVEQERLKCYWIGHWYCTDSWVGYRMYLLDDIPVAVSVQHGRKCKESIHWFSDELARKVREYALTFLVENEEELCFRTCDIDEEFGETYKIFYNDHVLDWKKATYEGQPVRLLEKIRDKEIPTISKQVRIKLPDGKELVTDVGFLDFKYNLKEEE